MSRARAAGEAIWAFVVGDDWRIAIGVAVAIAATALLADTPVAAWWALPVAVALLLVLSVRRALAGTRLSAPPHAEDAAAAREEPAAATRRGGG